MYDTLWEALALAALWLALRELRMARVQTLTAATAHFRQYATQRGCQTRLDLSNLFWSQTSSFSETQTSLQRSGDLVIKETETPAGC